MKVALVVSFSLFVIAFKFTACSANEDSPTTTTLEQRNNQIEALKSAGATLLTRVDSSTGKNVVTLRLVGVTNADQVLKNAAHLSEITAIDLSNSDVSDLGLKELASLENLTSLNLNQTKVTDTGVEIITGFARLSSLNLGHTAITGGGLKPLGKMKNLTELAIGYQASIGLQNLVECEHLSKLDLSEMIHQADSYSILPRLTALSELRAGTLIDSVDEAISHITECKNLVKLDLLRANMTDESLKKMARLNHLAELAFDSRKVSDDAINELMKMPSLNSLRVENREKAFKLYLNTDALRGKVEPVLITYGFLSTPGPTQSPDGKIGLKTDGERAQLIDLASNSDFGKPFPTNVERPLGSSKKITKWVFSPDGKMVAIVKTNPPPNGGSIEVSIWDVDSQQEVSAKHIHPFRSYTMRAVAFSANGKELIIHGRSEGSK
jgi:hypothetical protein